MERVGRVLDLFISKERTLFTEISETFISLKREEQLKSYSQAKYL